MDIEDQVTTNAVKLDRSNRKKIYISGCGGMLGEAFYHVFRDDYDLKCTDIDVNEDWLSYCDIRDFEEYKNDVYDYMPDYLFHLGAYTDLEYCELHADDTYLTNTISVEHAVTISNNLEIPLLFISTAGIFDGKKEVYDDWDVPNPLCHYARSKYAAERYIRDNYNQYLICRAGWMMGGGPIKDKKFVNKVIQQLRDGKKELFIVNDKAGTPTYTFDFAGTVKHLLENGLHGLYNLVCEGGTTRLEVAHEIIKILNREGEIRIKEVSSDYFQTEYFAPRPESERLMNRKLRIRGADKMRNWKVALNEYLYNRYKDDFR